MGERFFDASHARQKLNSTVCMYKKKPYFVHHLDGEMMECFPIGGNGQPVNVPYTDPDFDYSHVPLGYITFRGKAHYLAREPQRINSQGLPLRAIIAEPTLNFNNNELLLSKAFRDCVLGDHPSFDHAMRKFSNENTEGVAVSRHIAIQRVSRGVFMALYRGRAVALSDNKGSSFRIIDSPNPLLIRKRLEKAGIPIVE